MDMEKVIKGLYACTTFGEDGVTDGDCKICPYDKGYATGECWVQMNRDALALLKEQEEQKRKWLQTIADTQLAISPTGYESEDEMAKRGWEWNGLQMAWEIIAGEERSEHPRLVRCKDCENKECWGRAGDVVCGIDGTPHRPDWFCADGERKSD